ncbi:MAG: glycoside hydrolase family 1 [Opitutales bacterium]|nr:glycoside hydrolase family 1 [Opitutales bacterium]
MKKGIVCFDRDWNGQNLPELYWGDDHLKMQSIEPASPLGFAKSSGYMVDGGKVIFLMFDKVRKRKGQPERRIFVAGPFNDWAPGTDAKWELETAKIDGKPCYRLAVPVKAVSGGDPVSFKYVTGDGEWLEVPSDAPDAVTDAHGFRNFLFNPGQTGRHRFYFVPPLSLNQSEGRGLYHRKGKDWHSLPVQAGVFLKKLSSDLRLGSWLEDGATIFRLFAPRARSVKVHLSEDAESAGEAITMRLLDGMVWELRLEDNRAGWYYFYSVTGEPSGGFSHFDPEFKVLDPYARAVVGPLGPAIVTRDEDFPKVEQAFQPPSWHDLVIAEAHVRDLTHWAPVAMSEKERLGFSGLRKWVESEDFYLTDLGVNAVELQPIQEFDTVNPVEYGWGYMPVNYFAPASQYGLEPESGSQVDEFRALVEAFHRRGLAVILDVVYNHVGEPNYLQYIDKEYYFLLDGSGRYLNHSGCGNTLDADAPMVRRLMRDSLVHLIERFDVDGFRFDLGELIGVDALHWLELELKQVKPSVVMIAEPWSFRGHISKDLRPTGVASWNDGFRETVCGYLLGKSGPEGMLYHLKGSHPDWTRFPAQTINYTESHDDRCWIDKITENHDHNGSYPTATDRRRTHLMASLLFVSIGVPMINSGLEMLKSKSGVRNTYLRGDLNAVPYERAAQYSGTATYFRQWIAFRQSTVGRHFLCRHSFPSEGYFHAEIEGNVFGVLFNADFSEGSKQLLYAVNPTFEPVEIYWDGVAFDGFVQIADAERFEPVGLDAARIHLHRHCMRIPPLSCGLWLKR